MNTEDIWSLGNKAYREGENLQAVYAVHINDCCFGSVWLITCLPTLFIIIH